MKSISILTVCFNSEKTIRETILSVLNQTYKNIEYIIIDGSSTDCTMDIAREYEDRIQKITSEPDNGLYDAMNKGIKLANGEIIGILNSDDLLADPNQVALIAAQFSDGVDAIYGDLSYFKTENPNQITRFYNSASFSPWKIRFGLTLPHPTFYVRKECYERFGLYKTDYRVSADFELIARFVKNGIKLKRIPRTIIKMRQGGVSTTGFWWRIHQNIEIVRACKENGIYTNILFVMMKLPFKIFSIFKRS